MRVSILSLAAAVSVVTATEAGIAPAVTKNFPGASYVAYLPKQEKYAVTGTIIGGTPTEDSPVQWSINVENLPAEGGPFSFHIHKAPVPADGNCSGTLSHFDPWARGESPPCDPDHKDNCEVGDLSGKYGTIKAGIINFQQK